MDNIEQYRSKKIVIEMLSAFVLFKEEGLTAVERMYPQHKYFVLENEGKSRSEVKQELLYAFA